jgi:hypothetical protein
MPDKNVFIILNRAFVDERFRQQLMSDLDSTVKGMGLALSEDARAELKKALDEGHDFATGLDQRVSQSGFALNPAALIRQKGVGKEQVVDISTQSASVAQTKRHHSEKKHSNYHNTATADSEVTTYEPVESDELDIEVETD